MVTELGLIDVLPGHQKDFERDMAYAAEHIIGLSEGFLGYTPYGWGIENPNRFMFLARWETIEHHKVIFWNSPAHEQVENLVGPHMDGAGSFEHYSQ
ncbi:MAG: antibiotic biosynthesis monooxygenase [Actinobacteria bacterium]|nr:antibiotic biosynthesis monooxygenase [Actinomycetota bacterium]